MASVEGAEPQPRAPRRGIIPPQVIDLMVPPLKVGGMCGAAGAVTGFGAAIIGDAHPVFSSVMTGTQWTVLGTTYWFTRRVVIKAWGVENDMTPTRKVIASTIASMPPGAIMGLATKSGKSIPSSMLFAGVVAGGGQVLLNTFTARRQKDDGEESSIFDSKWSPLKKLTDAEYADMMGEKILRVEADIALIDEHIDRLKEQQGRAAEGRPPGDQASR